MWEIQATTCACIDEVPVADEHAFENTCTNTHNAPMHSPLQLFFNQHSCKTMVQCSGLLPFLTGYLMKESPG